MTDRIHPDKTFSFFSTSTPIINPDKKKYCHEEYEINVVISGSCRYHICDDDIELRPGMTLMLGRNCPHYITSFDNVVLLGAHIFPEMIKSITEEPLYYNAIKWGHKNDYFMRLSRQNSSVNLMKLISENAPVSYRVCIDQNITAVVTHLLETFSNDIFYSSQLFTSISYYSVRLLSLFLIQSLYEAPMIESQKSTDRIIRLREYLNTHFTMNMRVEDMAEHACMSVSHFTDLFKQEFNVSPKQYIINKRLGYSCQLLEQKDMSIAVIANQCGFHDVSHFYVSFKRKYGVSPAVYRKKGGKGDLKIKD